MQYSESKLLLLLSAPGEHSGGWWWCVVGQMRSITKVNCCCCVPQVGQMHSIPKVTFCCCVPQLNIPGVVVVTVCSGSKMQYYKSKLLFLLLCPPSEHPGGYDGTHILIVCVKQFQDESSFCRN